MRTGCIPQFRVRPVIIPEADLHVFMLDFNNEQYHTILDQAAKKDLEPAQVVQQAVLAFLEAARQQQTP